MREGAEESRVREMLKNAFADVPCPHKWQEASACGPLTHEECLGFRRTFYNYEADEVHYMLPFLLQDLMNTRTGSDVETEDAEHLIMQLDPMNEDLVIQEIKLAQFAHFTHHQSLSICEWLKLAKTWEDLTIFKEEVDSATRYWCGRAALQTVGL